MKKVICLSLSIVLLYAMFSFNLSNEAKADTRYNSKDAISFAIDHWDDNVGKCANFVTKCLNAGGLNVSGDSPYDLLASLKKNVSGSVVDLSKSGNYVKATTGIAIGDPIFIYCPTCDKYPHVVLYGGTKDGCITYYAHNETIGPNGEKGGVCNSKKLNLKWTSGDHAGHKLVAKAFHITATSTTKKPKPLAQADFSLATEKGLIKVTCKINWDATQYEVVYSTDSKFKKDAKTTIVALPAQAANIAFSIRDLKSGKKYYVKIRACIIVTDSGNNDVYYYSDYCKSKSIKVK